MSYGAFVTGTFEGGIASLSNKEDGCEVLSQVLTHFLFNPYNSPAR